MRGLFHVAVVDIDAELAIVRFLLDFLNILIHSSLRLFSLADPFRVIAVFFLVSIVLVLEVRCLFFLNDSYSLVALQSQLLVLGRVFLSFCGSFLFTLKFCLLLNENSFVDLVEVSVLFVESVLI